MLIVFFLLFSLYRIPFYSLPHPWRALKILKPLAIYSSFLTTLSSQPFCLWSCSRKWKYLHGAAAQLSTVYQEGKIKNKVPEKPRWKRKSRKQKEKTNWEPPIARSLAHGGPPSPRISLTHFDEEEEREGENFLMFFSYLAFLFYLPFAFMPWTAECCWEATRRCGRLMGFSFLRRLRSLSVRSCQVFKALNLSTYVCNLTVFRKEGLVS